MSIKNQHGIALMTVIVFLFLLSLTWLSFSFISSYEREAVQNQVDSEQASYVAEAGIQQALNFLSQDWDWQHWPQHGYIPVPGGNLTQGSPTYYQWSGTLGDSNQTYTVQIRNDGKIQSKIRVGSPNLASPKRTIEVELGSAFDFGLYSHNNLEFQSSSFTVSGSNQTGYVYAKDGITGSMNADKITGNYSTAPWYLPKEIPLPELWKTKIVDPQTGTITWIGFEAKINGTPTATTIRYTIDSSEPEKEAFLVRGALLHNKTRGNFREISPTVEPDRGTNTITAAESPDEIDYPERRWAAGDNIVAERIEQYEGFWEGPGGLTEQLDNLINEGTGYASGGLPPYQSSFGNNTQFTGLTPFTGNTTFDANIIINGVANFGQNPSDTTILNQDREMMVQGNATFSGTVLINGQLYLENGSITINPGATVVIGPNGGVFVQEGYIDCSGTFTINGYCFVNGDVSVLPGGGSLMVDIPPAAPEETALYIRNGSLTVNQNLTGRGKIIVSQDIMINGGSLFTPAGIEPLFIAAGGNFSINNNIGNPFYGMVYVGEKANIVGSTNMNGGLLVVNGFDPNRPYLSGSSIAYQDYKNLLTGMGFTNNEDFVRPILWSDTTE